MTHTDYELRTADGTTILWLYPVTSVTPGIVDDEVTAEATERGEPAIARPGYRVTESLSVSCSLVWSDNASDDSHGNALANFWGQDVVSPQEQYNRLAHYLGEGLGAPWKLTWLDNEYVATDPADVDRINGTYPAVVAGSISGPYPGGRASMSITIDFSVGIPRTA